MQTIPNPPATPNGQNEIISYQKLRTFIGIIGFFLPFILVLGCYALCYGKYAWQPSISHYFYTHMHIVFVGALCILGGFLITYNGNSVWESRVSNLAGFCAFGIAAFPTCYKGYNYPKGKPIRYLYLSEDVKDILNNLHFGFAGVLFLCFAIFCLKFFQVNDTTKTRQPDPNDSQQNKDKFRRRQKLYTICGWGILVSIALVAVCALVRKHNPDFFAGSTFWFETSSLLFFGAAWLVKGSGYWAYLPAFYWFMKGLR